MPETLSPSGVALSEGAILEGGGEEALSSFAVFLLTVKKGYLRPVPETFAVQLEVDFFHLLLALRTKQIN